MSDPKPIEKLCPKCSEVKPAAAFSIARSAKDGLYSKSHIQNTFGMTVEEYDRLIAQGCTICGSHWRMHMDHCHTTGVVRGPLCQRCNHMIGNAADDPERLEAGAAYLRERHFVPTKFPQI